MLLISFLVGCAHNSQNIQSKIEKKRVYTPMKVSEEIPEVKHEPIIAIDKEDMDRYERDQNNMRDFDKYMQERDRRLRSK